MLLINPRASAPYLSEEYSLTDRHTLRTMNASDNSESAIIPVLQMGSLLRQLRSHKEQRKDSEFEPRLTYP